jgi:exodeoxyribonuclease VII large subunit
MTDSPVAAVDVAWTPASLLRMVRARLSAADPGTRRILRLRAIPLPSQNGRVYRGQVYLALRDPVVQDARLQAVVPEALLSALEPGREAVLQGILDYQVREDRVTPLLCVSEVVSLGETRVASRDDLERRYADLINRPKRSPEAALLGERPRVALVVPAQGVALDDVTAQLGDAEPLADLRVVRVSMLDPRAVAAAIQSAAGAADVVLLTRGGGEAVERLDDEGVLRAVASCPVPVLVAVGHADNHLLVERVADRALPTPTAAGVWLRTVLREHRAAQARAEEARRITQAGALVKAAEEMRREIGLLRGALDTERERAQRLRLAVYGLGVLVVVLGGVLKWR